MRKLAVFLLAGVFSFPANAQQEPEYGGGHSAHHSWYNELKKNGVSCCSDDDCKPVRARVREDGQWEAFLSDKRWHIVPKDAMLDDKLNKEPIYAHACYRFDDAGISPYFYCFLKGGQGI